MQIDQKLISLEYAGLNRQLHEQNAFYGIGGGKHVGTVIKLTEDLNTKSILDYGCGKGQLAKSLPFL
jgi:2-polyprenyl-3-methyl-5-hydroxy-6-metoxy-1,4-benzoquinol methylase